MTELSRARCKILSHFVWLAACFWVSAIWAQPFDQALFAEMRWRCIGPHRGGRTVAIAGVPTEPTVFYMAAVNGGVWKTNDSGQVWTPIFDSQPTGSVGAIAVAASDPKTIFVGSGEGLQRPDLAVGDGIYKSTDGGESWRHLGLRDGQQIATILVGMARILDAVPPALAIEHHAEFAADDDQIMRGKLKPILIIEGVELAVDLLAAVLDRPDVLARELVLEADGTRRHCR